MLRRYVLETLRREAKLQCFEDKVLVDPVMRQLVERMRRKGIADAEDVAVYFLRGVCGEVFGPGVDGCCVC